MMKTIYYPQDDILEIRLSDKPVAREVSQDWNVNVSYAEDGSVVELVILDAVKAGFMPFQGGDPESGLTGTQPCTPPSGVRHPSCRDSSFQRFCRGRTSLE